MTPMIPTPGDYRTADGQRITITQIGKRGKRAPDELGEWWNVKTGKHSGHPGLNIIGRWISPEAELNRAMVDDGIVQPPCGAKLCRFPQCDCDIPVVQAPAPKPLECWANAGGCLPVLAYDTPLDARNLTSIDRTRVAVHMIEASELARVQAERDEAVALVAAMAALEGKP